MPFFITEVLAIKSTHRFVFVWFGLDFGNTRECSEFTSDSAPRNYSWQVGDGGEKTGWCEVIWDIEDPIRSATIKGKHSTFCAITQAFLFIDFYKCLVSKIIFN